MADEFKDDEYHFSESDEGAVFDEEDVVVSSKATAGNHIKQYVIIGFGVLLCVLFVYKFVTAFFSGSKKTNQTAQSTTATQQQASKPPIKTIQTVKKPEQQEQQSYQPKVQTVTKTITDPNITRKLNALQMSSKDTKDELSDVNDSIDSIKSALSSMSSKMADLNDNIDSLMQEIKSQRQALLALKRKPKRRVRTRRYVSRPKLTYYVQALIPGRAWLRTSTGKRITVVEGSRISGLGVVKVIDPHQGEVIMSNGTKIRFSSSDI